MNRWVRWYEGTSEDGKFRLVTRMSRVTVRDVIALWALMLEDAGNLEHRGVCNRSIDYMTAVLDFEDGVVERILNAMRDAEMVEPDHGGITICNFKKRQFDSDVDKSATRRKREQRARDRGACHAPVTRDTGGSDNRIQRTDTEKKEEETRARRAWPFDEFWRLFPNKVGKGAAEKAFRKVEKSRSVEFPFLLEALRRYAAKNDDRPWCNPATWLNQSRWTDEPAEAVGGKAQRAGSGGSLIAAIDKMRASLAGGQNQAVIFELPNRPLPGTGFVHGPGGNGAGELRRGDSGACDEPADGDSAQVQIPANYRGTG